MRPGWRLGWIPNSDMPKMYLLLGSNLGDRAGHLERARKALDGLFGPALACSGVAETEAVGFSGPPFLNQVLCYRTLRRPLTVLRLCKGIEREMGRTDGPEFDAGGKRVYHDRIIDIDILRYGSVACETPELVLPHPQLRTRAFVAPLLAEIERK